MGVQFFAEQSKIIRFNNQFPNRTFSTAFGTGLQVAFPLTKTQKLRTGINVAKQTELFSDHQRGVILGTTFPNATPSTIIGLDVENRQTFLQVPVLYSSTFTTKSKYSLAFLTGLQANLLAAQTNKTVIHHLAIADETSINKTSPFRYHSLAAVLGFDLGCAISPKLRILLEPNTRFTLLQGNTREFLFSYNLGMIVSGF
ncbi:MAG: hypothetical protein RLZZ292_64 [Bacteroidota bacterium]|jgi:hypothetical protein